MDPPHLPLWLSWKGKLQPWQVLSAQMPQCASRYAHSFEGSSMGCEGCAHSDTITHSSNMLLRGAQHCWRNSRVMKRQRRSRSTPWWAQGPAPPETLSGRPSPALRMRAGCVHKSGGGKKHEHKQSQSVLTL